MALEHGTIVRDGYQLAYSIEGTGPTALVIGSAIYYPRTFSQELRKKLRLVFIDTRAFAHNDRQFVQPVTLDTILEDIEYMREQLNLTSCIIIGHSGHGYMAIEYAKKYPNHVTHVALIGMGPDHSDGTYKAANEYLETLHEQFKAEPHRKFITLCLALGPKSWYKYDFDARTLWKDVHVNMTLIEHFWGFKFKDIDITNGLSSFDKPIFLGLGKFDYLVAPFYTWYPLKGKFNNLTIKLFEHSSHTPQYEEPELFDATLLEWLKSHS
jgi:proline iminopeptidase